MLKRAARSAFIVVAILAAAGNGVHAQKTVRLSQAPAEFRVFYKQFVATVKKGKIDQVAALTSFPFKYGFDAGDEGVWSKEQFVKNARAFLTAESAFLNDADPEFTVSAGVYTQTDGENAAYYTFRKKNGVFKFVSYIVEP